MPRRRTTFVRKSISVSIPAAGGSPSLKIARGGLDVSTLRKSADSASAFFQSRAPHFREPGLQAFGFGWVASQESCDFGLPEKTHSIFSCSHFGSARALTARIDPCSHTGSVHYSLRRRRCRRQKFSGKTLQNSSLGADGARCRSRLPSGRSGSSRIGRGSLTPKLRMKCFWCSPPPPPARTRILSRSSPRRKNGGRRVVCVWPKSAGGAQPAGAASKPAQLPDAASKYAYSVSLVASQEAVRRPGRRRRHLLRKRGWRSAPQGADGPQSMRG